MHARSTQQSALSNLLTLVPWPQLEELTLAQCTVEQLLQAQYEVVAQRIEVSGGLEGHDHSQLLLALLTSNVHGMTLGIAGAVLLDCPEKKTVAVGGMA